MKTIEELVAFCIEHPDKPIVIQGKEIRICGMAQFTTVNYPNDTYYKIIFTDHTGLVILPAQQQVYFSKGALGKAEGITDEMIGKQEITFVGQPYSLVNKNDYQIVKRVYVGSHKDIEGECRFSDYESKDGTKKMLSLGWLSYTGRRADVLANLIDIADITVG